MIGAVRRDDIVSRTLHRILDISLIWAALVLGFLVKAGMVRAGIEFGGAFQPFGVAEVLSTFAAVAVLWLVSTSILETYSYKRELPETISNLTGALALTFALFIVFAYVTRVFDYPRLFLAVFGVTGAALLAISRIIKQMIRHSLQQRGRLLKRVGIVGTTPSASRLIEYLRQNPTYGLRVEGIITDDSLPDELSRERILGRTKELEEVIEEHRLDELIVALPGSCHQEIVDIAHRCQGQSVRLRVVPDLLDVITVRATLSEIGDIPLIGLRDPVINGYNAIIKRAFDIVLSAFILVVSWPILLATAIAIKLTSRGPVLYRQERVGENGRTFCMYKFRSMIEGADEAVDVETLNEPLVKKRPNDPRVTSVGRLLRRWSIDELPQFFNVLRGDMSVVGPRPEERRIVDHYNLWHRKRLSVKPGITGPMQVDGRADLNLNDRVRLEVMYIQNYSLLEDVKYIAKTLPAVWRGKGAY